MSISMDAELVKTLAKKLGQIQGRVKTTVLPANGSLPRSENLVEGAGTLAGADVKVLATYGSELQTNGSIYGEYPNQGAL